MIKINFSGKTIFEFRDNSLIQMVGWDENLKRLIVDIYSKVLNGHKFSDTDMESMNGYFPEVIQSEKILKKDDIKVIRISSMGDIMEQLQIKNNSILLEYLYSLNEELSITRAMNEIEVGLSKLSIKLDKLMENVISMGDVCVATSISGIDLKRIIKPFINIDFIDKNSKTKSLWLLKDIELINLFLNIMRLVIKGSSNVTIIIDGLDTRIRLETYNYFIDKLYVLIKEYSNLKIWLIPKTAKGVKMDCEIFENTYILNNHILSLGCFDITYESICRNYPDNNLPTEIQVLKSILKLFPFHYDNKKYHPSKETVILQVFLELLEEEPIIIENFKLSNLETNFLTTARK